MNMNTYKNVRIWVSTPLRIVLFWDRNTFEFDLYFTLIIDVKKQFLQ